MPRSSLLDEVVGRCPLLAALLMYLVRGLLGPDNELSCPLRLGDVAPEVPAHSLGRWSPKKPKAGVLKRSSAPDDPRGVPREQDLTKDAEATEKDSLRRSRRAFSADLRISSSSRSRPLLTLVGKV